ncbi:hypothetical protein E2F43_11455 [Seongchinamella unica]|uniref:Pyrrolo-quinoline quinone repeat domain-containing protein n=1 Tax=Seongchinamella unica TaxID=2547392 RepID=A0A4V2ZXC2_9GAMM|nr:PQQ-binding-like beta-propeller repeat protein [Seongchinamella unica]TDG14094.1 hypothetical protein E2F43_11455 [Seongchinamella unica]
MIKRWLLTLVLLPGSSVASTQAYYSPGGWPTLHHDAGNRRSVDIDLGDRQYSRRWHALEGATVLTAPTVSPDGQSLYVTTGQGKGHSNLHAFTIDGELLWQSRPWHSPDDGVDPCALLSSPVIDADGDIYLSDCNQLFAFHADGKEKWVIPLPAPARDDWAAAGDHPVNAFTTAAFTPGGHVLGVTNFGDVMLVDRESGEVLNRPYRLPAAAAPYAHTVQLPDSLLSGGLMDEAFKEWAWQLIFGGSMRSANTPAVAANGRIFVVGSSATEGVGAVFGLDVLESGDGAEISTAFITEIGIGSGSSPALSPVEERVYVSDEEGWLYSLDTESGAIAWKVKTQAAAGAAGVADDGTVYALQSSGAAVIAISPDGEIKWRSETAQLADKQPDSWLFGAPIESANGNPTITKDAIIVPILVGYRLPFIVAPLPVASYLVALDIDSGQLLRILTPLPDDSSGITAILPDGTLVSSIGAVVTSALAPLKPVVNWLLPANTEVMEVTGGIQVTFPD